LHQNFQNKKPIPGNLSQKSATRNSDGTSPPLQNKKTKKLNNPKCQRKNEQSRRETEKIEDPKPTTHTHTHNLLLLLRHGSHFHSSQWPKEDEEKIEKKKKETGGNDRELLTTHKRAAVER
jgi:hypothetical protein